MPELRLGTAGWSVPREVAERFAGPGTHLERYARTMNAVEINSSFYRPHRRATYARWAASTPPDFRFSVKTPRVLTQEQRLREPEAGLDRFASEVEGLGDRLGAVLVQTPPSLVFDEADAIRFFDAAAARLPVPIAFEPRHASWFAPEVDAWLKDRRIARVAADPAPVAGADAPGGWRGLTYIRLHGAPRIYYSAYAPEALAATAARVLRESAVAPTWCVFDNTAEGYALPNALTVMAASGQEPR
ncbi:MAG: DUF72 domain-containing protein [Brevundimonas sp.]|uniref:DUF72 domain-containing protein n=1 Tax=Brevundimonas sp. TaxID=1871086 RepID=UPI000DB08EB3|nr:DUF72 domain-containing protein [Brevundimonas sp.]PZT98232.1 MAG: DUF72 domain-containing protein [Brevundimonas sp.]